MKHVLPFSCLLYWCDMTFDVSGSPCSVTSADNVRSEQASSVSRVTSYSAGAQRGTNDARHSEPHVYATDHRHHAWTSTSNLPCSNTSTFPAGKPPLPPLSHGSDACSPQHVLSRKEENLTEEWFVDLTWCDLLKLNLSSAVGFSWLKLSVSCHWCFLVVIHHHCCFFALCGGLLEQ